VIEWPKKLESCTITILIPQSGTILSFAKMILSSLPNGKSETDAANRGAASINGLEEVEVAEMSPWLDLRVSPKDVKLY